MSHILAFVLGAGVGGAMIFTVVFDAYRKKLEEEKEIAYAMGYSSGLSDRKKPVELKWADSHGPE